MRRRKTRKTIKRRSSPRRTMARRSRTRRVTRRARSGIRRIGRGRGKFGNFLKTGLIGDTTQAIGAGKLVGLVTDRVAPQATPFATIGAEYLAGGIGGMVLAEGVKSFAGEPSILGQLTGLFGGAQGSRNEVGAMV